MIRWPPRSPLFPYTTLFRSLKGSSPLSARRPVLQLLVVNSDEPWKAGVPAWCVVRPVPPITLRRPDLGSPEFFNLEPFLRLGDPPVVMHHGIARVVVPDPHTATHDLFHIEPARERSCVRSSRCGQVHAQ